MDMQELLYFIYMDKQEKKAASDDEADELKLVVYDKSKKGFYVKQRHFQLEDMRFLAECIYSAKFGSKKYVGVAHR